eukprot:5290016-Pyramimonas_sp.AAC.1
MTRGGGREDKDMEGRLMSEIREIPKMLAQQLGPLRREVTRLADELKSVRLQAERASEMASSAMEAVRSLRADMGRMKHKEQERPAAKKEENEEDSRPRQVIVGGFTEELEQEELVSKVEGFLREDLRRTKVEKVFTFTDPARVGVIQFTTEAAKKGFYQRIRGASRDIGGDTKLRFADNRTFKAR